MTRPAYAPAFVAAFVLGSAAATLAVAAFGQRVLIVTAVVSIGLTMVVRDALHEAWRNDRLALRMAAMIAAGALVAYLVNRDASRVALASCTAFVLAESVDGLVYHRLRALPWLQRSNGSNLVAALVDSLTFPTIAFGVFSAPLVAMQFAGKFAGGLAWSLALASLWHRRRPARPFT